MIVMELELVCGRMNYISGSMKCLGGVITNGGKCKERDDKKNTDDFHFFKIKWFESEMLTT